MKTYDLLFTRDKGEIINKIINSYFLESEAESINYLPKFNKINIIVGANNSGKSRFIRYLMANNSFEGVNCLFEVNNLRTDYNNQVNETNVIIDLNIETYKYRSENTFYSDGRNQDKIFMNLFIENRLLLLEDFKDFLSTIEHNKLSISNLASKGVQNIFLSDYNKISNDFYLNLNEIKRYYIPTLRTAHSLYQKIPHFERIKLAEGDKAFDASKINRKIEDDIFLETLNEYYKLDKIEVEVFTGIHLYKSILNTRNSKREIRILFENFEDFISNSFFEGKKIDIVAEFDKDESLKGNNHLEKISVHFQEEKETRKLYELGDGIQAIIILMYKIFMAEPNSFIFIDEPELNLHPGMQRLFLEQICNNKDLQKKDLTYIISTHSNHFLDLTIEKNDVSIYSFSPKKTEYGEKQFTIKNVNAGDNHILKNLGVNNSSVFMANCSIWVEGISDRNYIKAFLKSYCESIKKPFPKEDIDFAFFEYAGSNIDHYIFENEIEKEDEEIVINDIKALSLSNRIFLLADSDSTTKSNKSKYERLKTLENAKSDNFTSKIIWNFREIENLLTNEIWQQILIEYCNENLLKDNEKIIQEKINKALVKYNSGKYKKEYIGFFLNDLREEINKIGKSYILNKSFYETKSDNSFGTIINKRKLSELIFEKNFSWEVLSKNEEIKNLTIEIYSFIINKNQ